MEWEQIDPYHQRCRAYGGWLVKAFEDVVHPTECSGLVPGGDFRVAMAFVPDPTYQWGLMASVVGDGGSIEPWGVEISPFEDNLMLITEEEWESCDDGVEEMLEAQDKKTSAIILQIVADWGLSRGRVGVTSPQFYEKYGVSSDNTNYGLYEIIELIIERKRHTSSTVGSSE